MVKLLLVLMVGGALANGFASAHSQPPLLIDSAQTAPLDATN